MSLNLKEFEAKTKEEAIEAALEELGVTEKEILYKYEEKKGKLFKAGSTVVYVATIKDIADYLKEALKELVTNMGIEVNIESNIREEQINLKMYSDNNNILIGKNGQTLTAITTILKQMVYNEVGKYPYILLDVENYKEKNEERLIRSAKKIAKEVAKTKVEAELENMNSYQRRLIHNALTDFKGVYTESVGEEPNRHIVIKPKEA
jgi:spoIIIJ-associated protein